MSINSNMENQLDRLENRLDALAVKMDTHQYCNLQLIHTIDKKVEGHASVFRMAQWMIPSGGLLAVISVVKSFWH